MVGLGISEPSTCSAGQASFLQPAPPVRFASKAILEAVQLASPRYSHQKRFTVQVTSWPQRTSSWETLQIQPFFFAWVSWYTKMFHVCNSKFQALRLQATSLFRSSAGRFGGAPSGPASVGVVLLHIEALCAQALFVRFDERLAFLFAVHGDALISGCLGGLKLHSLRLRWECFFHFANFGSLCTCEYLKQNGSVQWHLDK